MNTEKHNIYLFIIHFYTYFCHRFFGLALPFVPFIPYMVVVVVVVVACA